MKLVLAVLSFSAAWAADADLILHNGKVVTVDPAFSIRQAVAVKDGRIVATGSDRDVLRYWPPLMAAVFSAPLLTFHFWRIWS